ncbi:MAG TPA: bifunctional methylenetetrahydrofolate dehydrogenase/methenyltetrahydrofolate cyclohydrolase FolD [Thermoanaerobaculia bacterium]|nr:bifunctional methylenetetrahydrofolate dehydrogenase/methenyltetrahydrofolate cyclohydrolase FolD [Thermoanaerobaculia bacterium]
MTRLLDGRAVAAQVRAEVAAGVRELLAAGGRPPGLAAVLAGDDPASRLYVDTKEKAAAEVGIRSRIVHLPADAGEERLLAAIEALNGDEGTDGILVQLPLPRGIDARAVLDGVDPAKDVDGFHPLNVGRLWLGRPGFVPATPRGVLELLRRSGVPLAGRHAVVVGRSDIVGKPLAALLLREHCTVTVCHSRTRDLAAVTRTADLLVAAAGRPALLGPEHVREGAVVVDVGIHRLTDPAEVERLFPGDAERRAQLARRGGVVVGDVDFARVAPRAAAITPVPGGVGPLTVAMLLANTLDAARARRGMAAPVASGK